MTIFTPGAIIVIEGKRTETGTTKATRWMKIRHQILRHIDDAWEIRDKRRVFGFFIVESDTTEVPEKWINEMRQTISESAVNGSLPHRTIKERAEIRNCFIGATTWKAICQEFNIKLNDL